VGIFAHREQILYHHRYWDKKPALRAAYGRFYRLIASNLSPQHDRIVELGSGIGNIKEYLPDCLTTDMFPTPWSEQVENAYHLSFQDGSVSDLILVDVFHHLQYPGSALQEFWRVLRPGGRVLMIEPCISMLGSLVFGVLHPEGLRRGHEIQWEAPFGANLSDPAYYTSQGNATSVFLSKQYEDQLASWKERTVTRLSAVGYLASGGYTKPQLVPNALMPYLRVSEHFFDSFPDLFATRMLVVLTR
jgi:SAM-dependent methyltransferase